MILNNAKTKQEIEQQSYLFDDLIIEEILTRLPIKSILRFKSVSKQWYSTLSSPNFANAHFKNSPFSHPSAPVNTLFIKSGRDCYIFSYNDDVDQISDNFEDNLVKLDIDFDVKKNNLKLVGCCNGLVCINPVSGKYFILWNPATRKFHIYESDGYLNLYNEAVRFVVTSGFGFVSSADDYKYVGIFREGRLTKEGRNSVCIFSMRENRWRKIDFFRDSLNLFGQGVLVNEKLYWPADSENAGNLLVSFDLGVERFDVVEIDWDKPHFLGVMRGCLCMCNYKNKFTGDKLVHVLEPPAIVKSIGVPKGFRSSLFSDMIGFTKTDKFFVTVPAEFMGFEWQSRMLGIVDTRTEPMQYTTLLNFSGGVQIARYVPSLVSPGGGFSGGSWVSIEPPLTKDKVNIVEQSISLLSVVQWCGQLFTSKRFSVQTQLLSYFILFCLLALISLAIVYISL